MPTTRKTSAGRINARFNARPRTRGVPATVKRLPPKNAEAGAAEEGGGSVALTVFIYILLAALIAVIIYVLYRVIKNARSDSSDDARSFGSSVYNYDGMRKDDVSVSSEARKEASKKYANVGGNKHYYFQEKFEEDGKPTTGDRYTLVYLHMDGCGYCRKFDPVWEELKKKHAEELEKAGVYMESYESKSDEADKYYAGTGFPTVLLAKGGDTVATFEGQRTIPDILRGEDVCEGVYGGGVCGGGVCGGMCGAVCESVCESVCGGV